MPRFVNTGSRGEISHARTMSTGLALHVAVIINYLVLYIFYIRMTAFDIILTIVISLIYLLLLTYLVKLCLLAPLHILFISIYTAIHYTLLYSRHFRRLTNLFF